LDLPAANFSAPFSQLNISGAVEFVWLRRLIAHLEKIRPIGQFAAPQFVLLASPA